MTITLRPMLDADLAAVLAVHCIWRGAAARRLHDSVASKLAILTIRCHKIARQGGVSLTHYLHFGKVAR
jgi:nitrate/nitrite-specific signal transduction histidine kinase